LFTIGLLAVVACGPEDTRDDVGSGPSALIGQVVFQQPGAACNNAERTALTKAAQLLESIRFTPQFQSCIMNRMVNHYRYCQHPRWPDPPFVLDVSRENHAAQVLTELKFATNQTNIGCVDSNEFNGRALNEGPWGHLGTNGFLVSRHWLRDNVLQADQSSPMTWANVTGLVAHELTHAHFGYVHRAAGRDCGGNGYEDSMSVPTIVEGCTHAALMAGRVVLINRDDDRIQTLGIGIYRADELNGVGGANHTVRHLFIGPWLHVRLCKGQPGGVANGQCREFRNGVDHFVSQALGQHWTANFRYIEIRPLAVSFMRPYYDPNADQQTFNSHPDQAMRFGYDAEGSYRNPGGLNRDFESLKLGPGLSATTCADADGTVGCWPVSASVQSYPDLGEHSIRYLAITPQVEVYADRKLYGARAVFPIGTHSGAAIGLNLVKGDNVESIVVPPGLKARVCDGSQGEGPCGVYSRTSFDLGHMRNVMSYIRVYRACGDGALDNGEACDSGALNGTRWPHCNKSCSGPVLCGNRVIDPGETCDAGLSNGLMVGGCNFRCNGIQLPDFQIAPIKPNL
jgi:hypothetical protein